MMCSRDLRKHLITHLSDVETLQLRLNFDTKIGSKAGETLVRLCGASLFTRFKRLHQGHSHDSSCQASVLVLEFLLRLITESESHTEIDKSIKQEAEKDSIAWRKSLLSEGGLSKACEIDARGLLLFVACFEIPKVFKNEDVRDLIRFSNFKEIVISLNGRQKPKLVCDGPPTIKRYNHKG
ncbi:hypothetical protein Pint_01323 [Pistacia integerrima]|uniref:Uncharacterized protein n=1 Tax=Pistacia integerrima TaxID=434235 RepID=A0ACC0ZIY7_9ROSI|nr:hypothetical protein Pint_01323 [Pistacia integerrima]